VFVRRGGTRRIETYYNVDVKEPGRR